MRDKIKLKILVNEAAYFLEWELPFFRDKFALVNEPAEDVVLLAFGPDVFKLSSALPALKRAAVLFPGFFFNPYHDVEARVTARKIADEFYDVIFTNPGPIEEAFKDYPNLCIHPFSIDVDKILKYRKVRTSIDSLLHVSAPSPQKDWERSAEIMELTGLKNEVFPLRSEPQGYSLKDRLRWRYNKYITRRLNPVKAFRTKIGYVDHGDVVKKYSEYDGFVHIAGEIPLKEHVDGKYTAALLEAGTTGSILFWHDTLALGNDFETIFSLPKDVNDAAREILSLRSSIDVERHSKATSQEIADRCHPRAIIETRYRSIEKLV
ncbi:MAG: hypothetical protein DMF63_08485 [Acidobacteria bacterium]|nr:MAG: hypothetical protein DMF63_08485 [Acidobacteriota bacterium]